MADALKFSVPDMSCGHCKAAVERAIAARDANAKVTVDLDAHMVAVESTAAPEAILSALAEEGYPAERL